MKVNYYILLLITVIVFSSCAIDNYDEPEALLTGNIVYNGEAIPVENDRVHFQLWQPGFGKSGPINVAVYQDGSYSALLFPGDYKLIFSDGQGPFKPIDTMSVALRGSQELDIEVTPYYMIRNAQFSNTGTTVTGSCSVEQIVTGDDAKNVESVTLYINKTQFVSGNGDENIEHSSAPDLSDLSNINLSVEIPDIQPTQNYVFARIGVKIADVEDMIFTQVEKISY